MRKARFLAVLLVIALVLPMALAAQTEVKVEKVSEAKCMKQTLKFSNEINLKLKKMELELKLMNLDLMEKKKELQKGLHEEYLKEKIDRKAIEKITKEMLAADEKLHMNRIGHMIAVREMLTPEQWKVFMDKRSCCGGMGCCGSCMGGSCGGGASCGGCKGMQGCSHGRALDMKGMCGDAGAHKCIKAVKGGCAGKAVGCKVIKAEIEVKED